MGLIHWVLDERRKNSLENAGLLGRQAGNRVSAVFARVGNMADPSPLSCSSLQTPHFPPSDETHQTTSKKNSKILASN